MTDKHLTSHPSIDKPWLKYYTKPAPTMPSAEMSMYDFPITRAGKVDYQELERRAAEGESNG